MVYLNVLVTYLILKRLFETWSDPAIDNNPHDEHPCIPAKFKGLHKLSVAKIVCIVIRSKLEDQHCLSVNYTSNHVYVLY